MIGGIKLLEIACQCLSVYVVAIGETDRGIYYMLMAIYLKMTQKEMKDEHP
jgi:flagellar biosynthesis protein FlhB